MFYPCQLHHKCLSESLVLHRVLCAVYTLFCCSRYMKCWLCLLTEYVYETVAFDHWNIKLMQWYLYSCILIFYCLHLCGLFYKNYSSACGSVYFLVLIFWGFCGCANLETSWHAIGWCHSSFCMSAT
jgi:hypothetical protein